MNVGKERANVQERVSIIAERANNSRIQGYGTCLSHRKTNNYSTLANGHRRRYWDGEEKRFSRCQGGTSIVGITHVEFEKTRARLSKPRLQILGEIAVLWPVRFGIGRDMTLAAPEAGYNGFRGAHKPPVSHNQHHSLIDHTTGHTYNIAYHRGANQEELRNCNTHTSRSRADGEP
jgi:hypothetical protein